MKPSMPTDTPMPRALDYPQGWAVDKSHGQLQCDGTRAGRLARLADVACFVMDCYSLPPIEATAWLCDSLEAASPALYLLNESGRAVALPPDHSFAWVPFSWDVQPAPKPADCGLPGAVKHMREYWDSAKPGKAGYMGESQLDPLAIGLDDAFALWGFGTREPAYKAAGEVQPLEGWQPNTPYGFMAFDSTPAGRLVRLADIVRWLEVGKALPRLQALEALCAGLDAGALEMLYQVRPGDYAERKPANHTYGYLTISQAHAAQRKGAIAARGAAGWSAAPASAAWSATQWGNDDARPAGPWPSNGGDSKTQPQPIPVAPGLHALVRRIRETWGAAVRKGAGDVLDATTGELAALALPVDSAYSLWGWGSAGSIVQLHEVPAPVSDSGEQWTGEKLAAQMALYKSQGHKDYTKRTAVLASMGERDVRRLAKEFKDSRATDTGINSVFAMGKKTGIRRKN